MLCTSNFKMKPTLLKFSIILLWNEKVVQVWSGAKFVEFSLQSNFTLQTGNAATGWNMAYAVFWG